MIEITKENINEGSFVDKHWENPKKIGLKNKLSTNSKIIMYLLGAFLTLSIANATLIYSFYKILIKL